MFFDKFWIILIKIIFLFMNVSQKFSVYLSPKVSAEKA